MQVFAREPQAGGTTGREIAPAGFDDELASGGINIGNCRTADAFHRRDRALQMPRASRTKAHMLRTNAEFQPFRGRQRIPALGRADGQIDTPPRRKTAARPAPKRRPPP